MMKLNALSGAVATVLGGGANSALATTVHQATFHLPAESVAAVVMVAAGVMGFALVATGGFSFPVDPRGPVPKPSKVDDKWARFKQWFVDRRNPAFQHPGPGNRRKGSKSLFVQLRQKGRQRFGWTLNGRSALMERAARRMKSTKAYRRVRNRMRMVFRRWHEQKFGKKSKFATV